MKEQASNLNNNSLKRRRRALKKTAKAIRNKENDDGDNDDKDKDEADDESDIEDADMITKQYIPEIILEGFTLNRDKMKEILNGILTKTPKVVIDLITEYSTLFSIGGLSEQLLKTRIVLENCFAVQCVVFHPILELVVRNCGGCDVQVLNVERSMRVYNSRMINLYTKGECTSYRFEKCSYCKVEALDTRRRVIFMSLFSDGLCFKMFNAYFPNDESRCVAVFGEDEEDGDDGDDGDVEQEKDEVNGVNDDGVGKEKNEEVSGGIIDGWKKWFVKGNDECFLIVFRKAIDVSCFGRKTPLSTERGASMIPLI